MSADRGLQRERARAKRCTTTSMVHMCHFSNNSTKQNTNKLLSPKQGTTLYITVSSHDSGTITASGEAITRRGRARWLPRYRFVIVRTRVGFWGKFGRRWSSWAGVRTVDLRPKRSLLAALAVPLRVSISTSRLRPNLSPRRGCPVSSGSLAPRLPAQMGRAA